MSSDPKDFQIDPHALDVEWLRQPELYHIYAGKLADAKRNLEELKHEQDRVEAELQIAIRDNPDDYGLPKVTEAVVAAAVKDLPAYQRAQKAVVIAKHIVDLLQADCTALDHKRKALENLVTLHGLDYFSEPRAYTKEAHDGIEEIQTDSVRRRGRRRRQEREDNE